MKDDGKNRAGDGAPEFDADQREFFITGMSPGELDFGGDE